MTYRAGSTDVAFRFDVDQAGQIRAFDDLKHNRVSLYCSVWTPIKLPPWGRVAQLVLIVDGELRERSCCKADHEAGNEQLPMDPTHADLAMVSIRNPDAGECVPFHQKALLFGADSAVLHYIFFSRMHAALFKEISGPPQLDTSTTSARYSPRQ